MLGKYTLCVDGNVTESEWASYDKTTIKYDNLGNEVPYTTDVKATWDNDGVIISYVCKEPNMDKIKATASAREEIYQLGREVLCNAYRHARAKKIEMEMIYTGSFLLLHVRDDGVGFARKAVMPAHTSELRALFVIRRRLRALGGSLSVWSRSGIGSELSLVVPIG